MRLLFDEAKVNALFTNFPDVTVNWLKKTKSRSLYFGRNTVGSDRPLF